MQTRPLDADESEGNGPSKFLTFVIGEETYALDIQHVREIIGMQRITTVPDVPSFVKGVINLRGTVIPVMDVRRRFDLPERPYDDRTCIVVVRVRDWTVGLVVDTVSEVVDIAQDAIEPAPRVGGANAARYLAGLGKVGDRVRLLLDVERFLGAASEGA
jgi:purine-binding chemotaxis protein CheW